MSLLPARTAVLNYMDSVAQADVHQVMAALQAEYGSEKQFKDHLFLEHLMSLECNGYLDQVDYDLTSKEISELVIKSMMTAELLCKNILLKSFGNKGDSRDEISWWTSFGAGRNGWFGTSFGSL